MMDRWIEPQAYYPDLCCLFAENMQREGDAASPPLWRPIGPRLLRVVALRAPVAIASKAAFATVLIYVCLLAAMVVTP